VVNFHTIKPFDNQCVLEMANKCGAVVTVEEHSVIGGLGSAVAEVLAGNSSARFARIGIQDKFGRSGKPEHLFKEYGLTAENIVNQCMALKG
jgi:transketolase